MRNPDRPSHLSLVSAPEVEDDSLERKRLTRISDPEKWEIKQVGAVEVTVTHCAQRGGGGVVALGTLSLCERARWPWGSHRSVAPGMWWFTKHRSAVRQVQLCWGHRDSISHSFPGLRAPVDS